MGNFLATLDGPDLIQSADVRRESTVHTKDSSVDHLEKKKKKKERKKKSEKKKKKDHRKKWLD